eukprot:RCo033818
MAVAFLVPRPAQDRTSAVVLRPLVLPLSPSLVSNQPPVTPAIPGRPAMLNISARSEPSSPRTSPDHSMNAANDSLSSTSPGSDFRNRSSASPLRGTFTALMFPKRRLRPVMTQLELSSSQIPPILHQIWLGNPRKRPVAVMEQCRAVHANWTYMLWTEHNLSWIPYSGFFHIYRRRMQLQKASDIARYGVLERFGGIFLDVDIQCLRHFEPLRRHLGPGTSCWAVYEANPKAVLYLANGIMGCLPHAPALRQILAALPFRNLEENDHKSTGPRLISEVRHERHTLTTLP